VTQAALAAWNLTRSYATGGTPFGVSIDRFALQQGERVAITGPSGCGKSTILALLAGALRPDEMTGGLMLDHKNALRLWQENALDKLAALRAMSIGFVPQTAALLPFLTLRDNIGLPLAILNRPDPRRVQGLADQLGLSGILDRRPAQVSVGQRQRAAIARALAHRPAIVLADEPTAAVHPAQADEVLELLTDAAKQDGAALVLVTHDPDRAAVAGYQMAPCQLDATAPLTRFAWPPE
jgi:putative ABC transport system ATP-binding protein